MKAEQIMDALGKVKEDYIVESAPGEKKKKQSRYRWIAAAIACVMILTFFRTAPGVAALEYVKEAVTSFIEALFPPKEIPVTIEGNTEVISQVAGGQVPEMQEDGTATAPGFVIYYDPERYTMTEETGIAYIRLNTENDLLPCEVEIKHIPGLAPADVAKTARQETEESGNSVSEVHRLEEREGLTFHFSAGTNWDSACGDGYFLSDGRDGCFQITARYFVEAIEGHGVRFSQMVQTFQVIDPVGTGDAQ